MARIAAGSRRFSGSDTDKEVSDTGHLVTELDLLVAQMESMHIEGVDASVAFNACSGLPHFHVPVLARHGGDAYDLSIFTKGVENVGRVAATSDAVYTVVARSTVPPGNTEGVVRVTLECACRIVAHRNVSLAYPSQFLRTGSDADDVRSLRATVIDSSTSQTRKRVAILLRPSVGQPKTFDDAAAEEAVIRSANSCEHAMAGVRNEMVKVAHSSGRCTKGIAGTAASAAGKSFNHQRGSVPRTSVWRRMLPSEHRRTPGTCRRTESRSAVARCRGETR
jgi:UDPglucose 6-dehydrogenase